MADVTITGTGAVNLGVLWPSKKLDSFDASTNEGGITTTIETDADNLTGDIEEYLFSKGADNVTLYSADVDVDILLGDGNDTVTLATGTTALDAEIDGGTGINTIAMTAAAADALSDNNQFQGKISNFQRLEIGTADTDTVNMTNMDGIDHVIVNDGVLDLDNFADKGTVEIAKAGADLTVNVKDAGEEGEDSNELTVVTTIDDATDSAALGVDGVETIHIKAMGNTLLNLMSADVAETLNITGAGNLFLAEAASFPSASIVDAPELTLVDASAMTGSLGFTADIDNLVVKGGSGADSVLGGFYTFSNKVDENFAKTLANFLAVGKEDGSSVSNVKLYGNEGNDVLAVKEGAVNAKLYGGDGKDVFLFDVGASNVVANSALIMDANAGDILMLEGGKKFKQAEVEVQTGITENLENLIEAAMQDLEKEGMGWFNVTTAGEDYTYIVLRNDSIESGVDNDTFGDDDMLVGLVGTHDLSDASFNADAGTLIIA